MLNGKFFVKDGVLGLPTVFASGDRSFSVKEDSTGKVLQIVENFPDPDASKRHSDAVEDVDLFHELEVFYQLHKGGQ